MKKISEILERGLAYFLAFLMGTMVVDVTWQVASRYLLGSPSSFTEELARYLMIWIGLVGAAYAFRKRSHLSLDLIMQGAGPVRKRWLIRFSYGVSLLFALSVMVVGGATLVGMTLELNQSSAALSLPIGLVYSCIPISGVLITWFALEAFIYPERICPDILAEGAKI